MVAELEALWAEHGDLETAVWDFGCGCCGAEVDPEPHFYVTDKYDGYNVGTPLIRLN